MGNAGDLLEEVALKGIASLGIHERQAEKLRRALLGRRGWEGTCLNVMHWLSGCLDCSAAANTMARVGELVAPRGGARGPHASRKEVLTWDVALPDLQNRSSSRIIRAKPSGVRAD